MVKPTEGLEWDNHELGPFLGHCYTNQNAYKARNWILKHYLLVQTRCINLWSDTIPSVSIGWNDSMWFIPNNDAMWLPNNDVMWLPILSQNPDR